MEEVFVRVLNMSLASSWLIAAILLLRFLLRRAPKWFSCLLWALAAFRLVCPVSIESVCSLIPSAEVLDIHNIRYETPKIYSGVPVINSVVNPVLADTFAPNPENSITPFHAVIGIAGYLWIAGILLLLLYAAAGYLRLVWSVREAIVYEGKIRICDQVKSPFILGFFSPKIYLPSGMERTVMEPVVAHEKAHLHRLDYVWKPLGFLILTIHWFNPLCWVAYILLCRDIEMACDERVIRDLNLEERKAYSSALLECSLQRRLITVCPLAFGEVGVKKRVKSVLGYKKPAFWLMFVAALAGMVIVVCFLTNPKQSRAEVLENSYQNSSSGDSQNQGPDISKKPVTPETAETEGNTAVNSAASPEGNTTANATANPEGNSAVNSATNPEENSTANPAVTSEEQAIRAAILEHNRVTDDPTGLLTCVNFLMLASECATPLIDSGSDSRCIYYGWALYEELIPSGIRVSCVSRRHRPVVLSFDVDKKGEYTLVEYWEPEKEGAAGALEIRAKVPEFLADEMTDGESFLLLQEQDCYLQAANALGIDEEFTEVIIKGLLDIILESPAASSNPRDYIDAHPDEYREMTCYGTRALRYFFSRFESGEESGLEGHIMMRACEDIMSAIGEEAFYVEPAGSDVTGQLWYDMYKNTVLRLKEQYSKAEIADKFPASYVLLKMLGEDS